MVLAHNRRLQCTVGWLMVLGYSKKSIMVGVCDREVVQLIEGAKQRSKDG